MSSASNFERPLSVLSCSSSSEELRQQEIDRLVDGELSADDEHALLLQLEDQPHGWRACALAFLEARTWGGAARAFLITPTPAVPTATATIAPMYAAATSIPAVLESAALSSTPHSAHPQFGRKAGYFSARWLNVAAGIMIAFIGGAIVREYWPQVTGSRPVIVPQQLAAKNPPAAAPLTPSAPSEPATPTPALPANLRLTPVDAQGQSAAAAFDVPLVEFPPEWQNRAGVLEHNSQWELPKNFAAEMDAQGQTIRQETFFVRIRLDDGREAVLPFQRLQIVPKSLLAL